MELIGIEHGGGAVTQSPGELRERRGTSERGGKAGDQSEPIEPLVRFDQLASPTGGPGMAVRKRGGGRSF
jgi:hypothetical protein